MTIIKESLVTNNITVTINSVADTPDNSIPHERDDLSTFSKVLALYSRNADTKKLYCIEEKQNCKFMPTWDELMEICENLETKNSPIVNKVQEYIIPTEIANKYTNGMNFSIKVSEYKREDESQIRGCITTIENENKFNDWFVYHILQNSRISSHEKPVVTNTNSNYHEILADFFAENIKNTVANDQWDFGGRNYFVQRVKYFTDRNMKIEAVLPAFPCKSSNVDKVSGTVPDKGEEFALRRLIKIVDDIKEIYQPGIKIWIISDGHVFSDCIGVDDGIVNTYTRKLRELYERICKNKYDSIGFCGLNELFFSDSTAILFNRDWVREVEIDHFTGSQIDEISDISRQVLMRGCDTDDGRLRRHISIKGHPRLHLYRGFSKFMTEDLSLLPYFEQTSRKQFKKLVSKIAFNMIKRNDAYSNLVELMFPNHLRLSIHAHTNQGPKFGIKVISQDQCRIIRSLENEEEPIFEDLLHIPTPWHNCIVKFQKQGTKKIISNNKNRVNTTTTEEQGFQDETSACSKSSLDSNEFESCLESTSDCESEYENESDKENCFYFLTKSKVVKDAIAKGLYEGNWKDTCFESGDGGHFIINKRY